MDMETKKEYFGFALMGLAFVAVIYPMGAFVALLGAGFWLARKRIIKEVDKYVERKRKQGREADKRND